uniref:Thymidine kinase n=1 Tax=Parascaris equorum TaxID=6256 RepID=A0A914RYF0_PAREQ
MFSGKTTEMLRRLNRYKLANRTCRIVKYRNDTRYALDHVATHDLLVLNRNFFLLLMYFRVRRYRRRFKNVLDMCPFSEDVIKLNAVCTGCGEDASFTKRLTSNTDLELIGGREMYTAMCRQCYFDVSQIKQIEIIFSRLMHDGVITTHIANVFDELLAYKVIAIDEGQFEFASKVLDLCPLAEKQEIIGGIETYRATCRACYADALRSENSQNHSARSPLRDFNMATVSNEGLTARKKIRTRLS